MSCFSVAVTVLRMVEYVFSFCTARKEPGKEQFEVQFLQQVLVEGPFLTNCALMIIIIKWLFYFRPFI